jgi:hypothetical protein
VTHETSKEHPLGAISQESTIPDNPTLNMAWPTQVLFRLLCFNSRRAIISWECPQYFALVSYVIFRSPKRKCDCGRMIFRYISVKSSTTSLFWRGPSPIWIANCGCVMKCGVSLANDDAYEVGLSKQTPIPNVHDNIRSPH